MGVKHCPEVHKDTGVSRGTDDKVVSPSLSNCISKSICHLRNPTTLNLHRDGLADAVGGEMKDDVHSATAKGCHFVLFFPLFFFFLCDLMKAGKGCAGVKAYNRR